MKVLLLSAGLGTRLLPITESIPKCLIQIQGISMLKRWVITLDNPKIDEIIINTNGHRQKVLSEIKSINSKVKISEVYEEHLLGTAGTLIINSLDSDNDIMVVHCDNFSSIKIEDFIDYHIAGNNFISMALFKPTDKSKCGMVEMDKDGIVVQFIEKPSNSHLEWANAAVYIFSEESLNEIRNKYKKAKDISLDILPNFLGRMSGYKINDYHIDIGTHESLTETIVRFQ
jgi:mannose-1-phosphate guanylyltransferase